MANFCAKFELFFLQPTNILCWRTQNCLLASFHRCVYLLTNINHREYGKLAIKIIRHFLIRNEHLCVCVLVSLFVNYLLSISSWRTKTYWFLWSKMEEKTHWKHFISIGIDKSEREKEKNIRIRNWMHEFEWGCGCVLGIAKVRTTFFPFVCKIAL